MRYFASCSFGKDSAAMVLRLIEEKWPLDEVIFYNTGMEFDSIYGVRDFIKPILEANNVKFTELSPSRPFLYDMLEKPVTKRDGRTQCGYGWCGGACRWGTSEKLASIDKYIPKEDVTMYVGIAADEPIRLERLAPYKRAPLAEWGMTERDCLEYCRAKGIKWDENGIIDLYGVLDRVSCWCCRNKNQAELRNIWKYLPEYWNKLKELQDKIGEPMKKFRTSDEYGDLGDLHNLEKLFVAESQQMSLF